MAATNLMKEALNKINTKIKTKGRFQVEIATNGYQNRRDMAWAQKANPEAHAALLHREALDIKMLQKKKQSREMSSMLWMKNAQTQGSARGKSMQNARGSVTSDATNTSKKPATAAGSKTSRTKAVAFE